MYSPKDWHSISFFLCVKWALVFLPMLPESSCKHNTLSPNTCIYFLLLCAAHSDLTLCLQDHKRPLSWVSMVPWAENPYWLLHWQIVEPLWFAFLPLVPRTTSLAFHGVSDWRGSRHRAPGDSQWGGTDRPPRRYQQFTITNAQRQGKHQTCQVLLSGPPSPLLSADRTSPTPERIPCENGSRLHFQDPSSNVASAIYKGKLLNSPELCDVLLFKWQRHL